MRWFRDCFVLCVLSLLGLGGCQVDLGTRVPPQTSSFGTIVYREACQRVSYSADLSARAKDPTHPIDVSGASYIPLCNGEAMPPADADPSVLALASARPLLVSSVDAALPDPLLDSFDQYLRALRPLEDDGTVTLLLSRSGKLLDTLSRDQGLLGALGRLDHVGGIHPPGSAGGLVRSVASAAGLDDFIGGTVPLLVPGGAARDEFTSLLTASAFELRHLSMDMNPQSPERTPALLGSLLLSGSADLQSGTPLLLAQRDFRGLPVLDKIAPPYVADAATGLAKANDAGHFVDAQGAEIPYVPPLPLPGQEGGAPRDSMGRALTAKDGLPLYRYTDLDASLLLGVLKDGHRLFGQQTDIPLGLLRGAALLAGSRDPAAVKMTDGEQIGYTGFATKDSVLLDLGYDATRLLRFHLATTPPGVDLINILHAASNLMAAPADEGPLSRVLKDLLDAADEAKKPDYGKAQIPQNSTLYDDLAPILARIFAVPNLAEDVVAAMQDPHVVNLGSMTAQLLDERGYFFMRQPSTADEFMNGLDPTGVIGTFGNKPDRRVSDSDATLDWRGQKTSDPGNNRSVMQRLLHTLADTNGGKPFCNARNAAVFGGLGIFTQPCDMFRVENIARFFLLSIADKNLRSATATFANLSASFLEAIKNGNDCRCSLGTGPCTDAPTQKQLCTALLVNIPDGSLGDEVLAGLIGINTFGRYPEPAPAGRSLFLDLWDPVNKIVPPFTRPQPEDLLLNHVKMMDGTLAIDQTDPDGRKFVDGNGKERLFIDEHNGVLFALEAVRGPAKLADGSDNPFPNDSFYDAFRPLVNAFARHAECFEQDMTGTCIRGQNAVQILADAMSVLHHHWPGARSQLFGRTFLDSYGPQVKPDAAVTYEPLGAKIAGGDLLLGAAAVSPILTKLLIDPAGDRLALPLFTRLLRYVFDPSMTPGLAFRDGRTMALRNDGMPAYADPTLARVLGGDFSGKPSLYYLFADALANKRTILERRDNADAKTVWDQAVSDGIDAFLKVDAVTAMGAVTYHFDNPRIRAESVLLLSFLQGRIKAHMADVAGWSDTLLKDLSDTTSGPLFAALLDLGVKIDADDNARQKTYTLLSQLLDEKDPATLRLMAVAAGDALQILADDGDVVPIGRALSAAADPKNGPADPGLILLKRGRELEQQSPAITQKPLLIKLLRNLYAENPLDPAHLYPMFRIIDAVAEVNRATPGKGGDLTAADYGALLGNTARFLLDQDRGLSRFIQIVGMRCLPGATDEGCPR